MKRKREPNIKFIVTIILFIIIMGTTVAYSSLSSSLSLSGEVVVNAVLAEDVELTNLACTSTSNPVGTISYNSIDSTTITSGISLPNLDSTVTCTANIVNGSSSMIKLHSITRDNYDNYSIVYDISNTYIKDIVNIGSTRSITITFRYAEEVTTLPADITLDSQLSLNFININTRNIILEGLTFYISGEDDVNSAGDWPDRIGEHNVDLIGSIVRNSESNSYYFNGTNTCGYTNATLFPYTEIGENDYGTANNFTVEVRVTPDEFQTNRSIIAQKRYRSISTTNEVGRFKPMDIFGGTVRYFWQYGNLSAEQSLKKNYANAFTNGQPIYMSLVNNNGVITRYINGLPVGNETLSKRYISKYTTQIGCFSTYNTTDDTINNSQNYVGGINTIRIYDRALSDEEIAINYANDNELYSQIMIETDLKTIAVTQPNNADLSGLYVDTNYPVINNESRYVYRGATPNNYIILGENHYNSNNELTEAEQEWRILSFEQNGNMKLVKSTLFATEYDTSGNRNPTDSPYCIHSADSAETINGVVIYKGCNAFTSQVSFGTEISSTNSTLFVGTTLNPAVKNNSTLVNKLNNLGAGTIYTNDEIAIINASNPSSWKVGPSDFNSTAAETLTKVSRYNWIGKVGTISMYDVKISSLNEFSGKNANFTSYIGSLAKSGQYLWTMTASDNDAEIDTWDVITILGSTNSSRSLSERRASRESQINNTFYGTPVIVINSDVKVTGTGTKQNPYRFVEE